MMDSKQYWPGKSNHQSSELDQYLSNCAKNQTVKYPQKLKAYDPWADWFNSSLDFEMKNEKIYSSLEQHQEINDQRKEFENNKDCTEENKEVTISVADGALGDEEIEEEIEKEEQKKKISDELVYERNEVSEEVIVWRSFPLK